MAKHSRSLSSLDLARNSFGAEYHMASWRDYSGEGLDANQFEFCTAPPITKGKRKGRPKRFGSTLSRWLPTRSYLLPCNSFTWMAWELGKKLTEFPKLLPLQQASTRSRRILRKPTLFRKKGFYGTWKREGEAMKTIIDFDGDKEIARRTENGAKLAKLFAHLPKGMSYTEFLMHPDIDVLELDFITSCEMHKAYLGAAENSEPTSETR